MSVDQILKEGTGECRSDPEGTGECRSDPEGRDW